MQYKFLNNYLIMVTKTLQSTILVFINLIYNKKNLLTLKYTLSNMMALNITLRIIRFNLNIKLFFLLLNKYNEID